MIQSPLTAKIVFTIGPVAITEPVVVTWGLMAALALGGWLATRSLSLKPSTLQTVLELIVGAIEDQIRGNDARRAEALCADDRHAVPLHPGGELVVADPGRRAADRPYRNRRGARPDRVLRHHLFRHPRARRRRLSQDLRRSRPSS